MNVCVWCHAETPKNRYCSASCMAHHREMARTVAEISNAVFSVNENGCWVWPGKQPHQYGPYKRYYRRLVGPIPKGLVPDHLCRNRPCVNPAHIELVTHRENTIRGTAPTAVNAAKTCCIRGHEFTPDNTYYTKEGWRGCRECKIQYFRKYNKKRAHKFREYARARKLRPGYHARLRELKAQKKERDRKTVECVVCGTPFETSYSLTCSLSCRGKYSRRNYT